MICWLLLLVVPLSPGTTGLCFLLCSSVANFDRSLLAPRFTESIEDSNFSSTVDLLANSAIFLYLGVSMPFSAWADASLTLTPWRLVLLAISILALRRIPCIFALQWFIPDIKTKREALFSGHFGPMGVGAIFIVSAGSLCKKWGHGD